MKDYLTTAVIGMLLVAATVGFAGLYTAAVLLARLPAVIGIIIGLIGAASAAAIIAAVGLRMHELRTEDKNDYRNY